MGAGGGGQEVPLDMKSLGVHDGAVFFDVPGVQVNFPSWWFTGLAHTCVRCSGCLRACVCLCVWLRLSVCMCARACEGVSARGGRRGMQCMRVYVGVRMRVYAHNCVLACVCVCV